MKIPKRKGIRELEENIYDHLPPCRFDLELAKTEIITMRVSKSIKEDIKVAAHRYGLSVTEYLTQLHRIVTLHRSPRWKPGDA